MNALTRAVTRPHPSLWHLLMLGLFLILLSLPARAADRQKIEDFLEVTGFDVALESIRLSADMAPQMLGAEASDFGVQWSRLVREVFDTDLMHQMSVEMLEETLEPDLLDHAVGFYGSDLGRRLVEIENKSHMTERDGLVSESGAAIIAGLVRIGSDRVQILKRLNAASDADGNGVRAMQEVQLRFLLAASAAGVLEMNMDAPDLRELLKQQEPQVRLIMQQSALENAAYTYQSFSDDEVAAYADALEEPQMQKVYSLLNAITFEIMANRFEAVALRLSGLTPSQDL